MDINETKVVRAIMPRIRVLTGSGEKVEERNLGSLANSLWVSEPIIKRTNRA
jgi:hypothetical protein